MKAIKLAAGYATRLYPLTENQPKPLLVNGGKFILDHIVEKMEKVESLDEVFMVTNNKFHQHFDEWKKTQTTMLNQRLLTMGRYRMRLA